METKVNSRIGFKTLQRCMMTCLFIMVAVGCSKDGPPTPQPDPITQDSEPIPEQNSPPEAFDLIGVNNGAVGVDVKPSFSWQAATDPDGDAVTYDFLMDTEENPTTVYKSGINGTSFEVTERLHLVTEYHWKVVAKDGKRGEVQSAVNSFTTRNLHIPDTPVTAAAAFSDRFSHSTAVFDNKLWVIGGSEDSGYKNDVWFSTDGANWEQASPAAAFSARRYHTTAVFDDKLWVIGGQDDGGRKNDVWFTTDGANWEQATPAAAFPARRNHTTAVFDGKLWVIGGAGGGSRNDVWYSSDGANWTEATPAASFSARGGHTTAVFDNKLWVIGGAFTQIKRDVWYSTDGANWEQASPVAAFSARNSHATVVFDDKLWVIGGSYGTSRKDDVWYSTDGANWEQAIVEAPFSVRSHHTSAVFDDRLWVIGGVVSGDGRKNDVWAMD